MINCVSNNFKEADSDSEYEYRVWTKEEFCNEMPDEAVCKS